MEVFEKLNLYSGRLIAHSKTGYSNTHPFDLVVFNARIRTRKEELLSGCDLNLTLDSVKLLLAAQELGEDLYVLHERDDFEDTEPIEIGDFKNKLYLSVPSMDFYLERFSFGPEPSLLSEFHTEALDRAERSQQFRLGRFYDIDLERVGPRFFLYSMVRRAYLVSSPEIYGFSDKIPTPIYSVWNRLNGFLKKKSVELNRPE